MTSRAFAADLDRFGPAALAAAGRIASAAESRAYCRRLACTHYENFQVASWLLSDGKRWSKYL